MNGTRLPERVDYRFRKLHFKGGGRGKNECRRRWSLTFSPVLGPLFFCIFGASCFFKVVGVFPISIVFGVASQLGSKQPPEPHRLLS
jgi:hypothetical protein